MAFCSRCGIQNRADSRFCRKCGSTIQGKSFSAPLPPRHVRQDVLPQEWLRIEEVLNTRDRLIGGSGAILVFIGAIIPWANVMTFWGMRGYDGYWGMRMFDGYWGMMSQSSTPPIVLLTALAGISALIFLFRKRSAAVVMGIGISIAAITLLTALGYMSSNAAPSWGVLFTLAGGGMLGYSGYLTRLYEGR